MGVEDLQFDKAEFQDQRPKCGACQTVLEGTYFQLAGTNICANCAELVRTGQGKASVLGFLRGSLYGVGAALAGAVGYGLFQALTGIEFALITIGIGWLVGVAMRKGAGGVGGRRLQVVAVVLAYLAITLSSIPAISKGMMEASRAEAVKNNQTPPQGMTAAGYVLAAVLSLFSPVLAFFGDNLLSALLGLFILAVGVWQAWKVTARDERVLSGPFEFESPRSDSTG